eukprot:Platyproteum_vivax@DN14118_c0_g1_i1.p1
MGKSRSRSSSRPKQNSQKSNCLYIGNMPSTTTQEMLENVFKHIAGYESCRIVPSKSKDKVVVGFVDFVDVESAATAYDQMADYKLGESEKPLALEFAKSKKAPRKRPYPSSSDGPRKAARPIGFERFEGAHPDKLLSSCLYYASEILRKDPPTSALSRPVEPSNSVYVDNLPDDISERELAHIFRPYPGYLQCRINKKSERSQLFVPGRTVFGFVEFQTTDQATLTIHNLQGYHVDRRDEVGIRLAYAKTASFRR